jgi:hypothetical protein
MQKLHSKLLFIYVIDISFRNLFSIVTKSSHVMCRNPSFGLATKAKGVARLWAKRKEARESRQRHCKGAGQEEARESHHILPGM